MIFLDHSFKSPAENLACEEALLTSLEEEGGDEILRIWESETYFVVVGHANKVNIEVNTSACNEMKVPIHRRHSGGGTVVQGPGCLNYSLLLQIDRSAEMNSIQSTNQYVLGRIADALQPVIDQSIAFQGTSDLTINGKKFSGNAQNRKRNYVLFHGTILYDFDLSLIQRLLNPPSKEPKYRQNRIHTEFVMNMPLSKQTITNQIRSAWLASETLNCIPLQPIQQLVDSKYSRDEWNYKF